MILTVLDVDELGRVGVETDAAIDLGGLTAGLGGRALCGGDREGMRAVGEIRTIREAVAGSMTADELAAAVRAHVVEG